MSNLKDKISTLFHSRPFWEALCYHPKFHHPGAIIDFSLVDIYIEIFPKQSREIIFHSSTFGTEPSIYYVDQNYPQMVNLLKFLEKIGFINKTLLF